MIRALHRKVRRLAKACMADRPAHEIQAFMLHGLAATADARGREVVRERLRRLRAERSPRAVVVTPSAREPASEAAPAAPADRIGSDGASEPPFPPGYDASGTAVADGPRRAADAAEAPARRPREPPLMIPNLADPKMHWEFVLSRPPPGPPPLPPPPYRDPVDDPMGLYGEPTEWRSPIE